ncbi:hypothetical protein ACFX15_020232 [Malus domestica]
MASAVPENLSREQYVYLAKLAEQAERYEEMMSFMDKLVVGSIAAGTELTVEEHNLLSIAYKNWTRCWCCATEDTGIPPPVNTTMSTFHFLRKLEDPGGR